MCIFRDAMGHDDIKNTDAYQNWLQRMSSPKALTQAEKLDRQRSGWLTQADIDRPDPTESPINLYPFWKRVGIWVCTCIFCLASWLLVYNGVKAFMMWWRW